MGPFFHFNSTSNKENYLAVEDWLRIAMIPLGDTMILGPIPQPN